MSAHRICKFDIIGTSTLSFSKYVEPGKNPKKGETKNDEDIRRREEKLHIEDGVVVIPAMALKFCIDGAAKLRSDKKKGKATWTKNFFTGIGIFNNLSLGLKPEDVVYETFMVSSTGNRGVGSRVPKTFPMIYKWRASAEVMLIDDEIPEEIFQETLSTAGISIGLGRFRPEVGGMNGRFVPDNFVWSN